jgi:hypothetical protein
MKNNYSAIFIGIFSLILGYLIVSSVSAVLLNACSTQQAPNGTSFPSYESACLFPVILNSSFNYLWGIVVGVMVTLLARAKKFRTVVLVGLIFVIITQSFTIYKDWTDHTFRISEYGGRQEGDTRQWLTTSYRQLLVTRFVNLPKEMIYRSGLLLIGWYLVTNTSYLKFLEPNGRKKK